MPSSESGGSAEQQPRDRQAGGVSGMLAVAARALAEAPADADDAALLATIARVVVPALGDVVTIRRVGEPAGQQPELVAPLDGHQRQRRPTPGYLQLASAPNIRSPRRRATACEPTFSQLVL